MSHCETTFSARRRSAARFAGSPQSVGLGRAVRAFAPVFDGDTRHVTGNLSETTCGYGGSRDGSGPFVSDDEIEEIKRRCEGASPGPWTSYVEGREQMSGSSFIMTAGEDIYLTGATTADQDFIAHARQDIPKLVAEVERLRKLLSE